MPYQIQAEFIRRSGAMVYLMTVENGPPYSVTDAFKHCAKITRDHYENFPVASWLMPGHLRPHICSIYAFARRADDFADEPGLEHDERLAHLDEWTDLLNSCSEGSDHPIFVALAETIRKFDIPISLLNDLLLAFRHDVLHSRHETFKDLITYSQRSANPVGRLILLLSGYRQDRLFEESDAICTALQLTNFWQDIAVDVSRDRVYIPQDEMVKYAVTEEDLRAGNVTEGFRSLVSDLVSRTRELFLAGRGLPDHVSGRLRYELRLTWLGGSRILDRIEAVNYDIFSKRPTIGKVDSARLLLRIVRSIGPSVW